MTQIAALAELLCTLFTPVELKIWLTGREPTAPLDRHVDWSGPAAVVSSRVAETLHKRRLVNRRFFDDLRGRVPNRVQEIQRVEHAWLTEALTEEHAELHTREKLHVREPIALIALAVTVFVTVWGTTEVVRRCRETQNLALAYWSVVVIVVAAKSASERSYSETHWLVGLTQSLTAWATVSWRKLAAALTLSAVVCLFAWVGLFRGLFQVHVADVSTPPDPDCRVGWLLVRVPCSDKDVEVWAPLRAVAVYQNGLPTPCARNGRMFECAPSTPPGTQPEDLHIYFQMSKELAYEKVIRKAFQDELQRRLGTRHDVKVEEATGTKEAYWVAGEAWKDIADEIVNNHPDTQYIVTVGSDASSAMIDLKVGERLAAASSRFKGLLILGVSDPVRAGYAVLSDRTGVEGRAVVRYGTGATDWANTVLRAFDQAKLIKKPAFIYDDQQKQDSWVADELKGAPVNGPKIDVIGPKKGALAREDLEPGRVYFAWYALDALVDQPSSHLKDYLIVPSTYDDANTRNFGVVVSVTDQEVGEKGASYLARALLEKSSLAQLPTRGPEFRIWINCSAVERKAIPLSPSLRRSEVTFVSDHAGEPPREDCVPLP